MCIRDSLCVAQYGVDALRFELGYKFVLVISALQLSLIHILSRINRVVLTNSMEFRKKGRQKLLLAIFVRMIHWMRNVLYLELSASNLSIPHGLFWINQMCIRDSLKVV